MESPTEHPLRCHSQAGSVYLVPNGDGGLTDVYHVEIKAGRTEDFQEQLVSYWAELALKYRQAEHRIHQIVLWPRGGGPSGRFQRDRVQLDYRSVSVPDDLDPEALLDSPLAVLALWCRNPPPDAVERVAEHIDKLDYN